MKERIQKILANAGVASRRNIEEMILQGRVTVNGKVRTSLPILITPGVDKISVDDEPVKLGTPRVEKRFYFVMNKPKGVFSTNVAQGEQKRAIDLLPADLPARVYPVGRLDSESKGLLLLTNDGELTNQLTHPRYGVVKTYTAVVDGFVTPETIARMRDGIWLVDRKSNKGFRTGKTHAKIVSRSGGKTVLEITIREGRNRQVRRTLAQIGHKVRDLTRTRMGPLSVKGLAVGQFRELTSREVRDLKRSIEPKPESPQPAGDDKTNED